MRKARNPRKPANHFLSIPEVQLYLGVRSRKTILNYIVSGALPAYKLAGTRWRIARRDIEEFLKNQKAKKIPAAAKSGSDSTS